MAQIIHNTSNLGNSSDKTIEFQRKPAIFADVKFLSGESLFNDSVALSMLVQSYITIFKGKPFFEDLSEEEVVKRLKAQLSNQNSGVLLAVNDVNEVVGFATLQVLPYDKLILRLSTALNEYTSTFLSLEEMSRILDARAKSYEDIRSLLNFFPSGVILEEIAVSENYRKGSQTIPFIHTFLEKALELSGNSNIPGFMWTANRGSMYELAENSAMRQIGDFAVLSNDKPAEQYARNILGVLDNGMSQEIYPRKEGEQPQGKSMSVYVFDVSKLEKATRYGKLSVAVHMFYESNDKVGIVRKTVSSITPNFIKKYLRKSFREG